MQWEKIINMFIGYKEETVKKKRQQLGRKNMKRDGLKPKGTNEKLKSRIKVEDWLRI